MIAVDTNILVYAHREELSQHEVALERLEALAQGEELWGIPIFCIGEFLRIISHVRLFDVPYTADEACAAVERFIESPSLRVLMPGPRYLRALNHAIRESRATGNLVFDAQIVAVCRESGVSALLTEDRDFARFPDFQTLHL